MVDFTGIVGVFDMLMFGWGGLGKKAGIGWLNSDKELIYLSTVS